MELTHHYNCAAINAQVGFDPEEKEADEAQKLRRALSANVNTGDYTLAE